MKSLAAIVCLLGLSVEATTYYVRTDGLDAHDGLSNTSGGAWLTIQHAANTAQAGDTVLVGTGTFTETVYSTKDGTSVNPITFTTNGVAVIDGGWSISNSWVTVRGFDITGANGVFINVGAQNVQVIYNRIRDITTWGTSSIGFEDAAGFGGPTNCFIGWNWITNGCGVLLQIFGAGNVAASNHFEWSCGYDATRVFGLNNVLRGNTFTNVTDTEDWTAGELRPGHTNNSQHTDILQSFALNGYWASNNVFDGNFIINCTNTQAFMLEAYDEANFGDFQFRNNVYVNCGKGESYGPRTMVLNNTFVRTHEANYVFAFDWSTNKGAAWSSMAANNILFQCQDPVQANYGKITVAAQLTNITQGWNCYVGAAYAAKTGITEPGAVNGGNPLFTDENGGTASAYEIGVTSPCIGVGTNLNSLFTTDFAGTTRGAAWDIGAYEYVAPAPPSAITLNAGNMRSAP